jgi:membrane fusion protein, multidrug efflux system
MKTPNATLILLLAATPLLAQETAAVQIRQLDRKLKLPAEIQPFQAVDIVARVQGFIERVLVDRGSTVKKGELLVELSAPEMKAQLAEQEAKAVATESQRAELHARQAGIESTLAKLKQAAATPGAVAANEIETLEQSVAAVKAQIVSIGIQANAIRATAAAMREIMEYLKVTAPFDGVITERHVHPGALAGPTSGPLVRLEQISRLRVVVSVPESEVGGIVKGAVVPFTVAGNVAASGTITRLAHSLDSKSRTMPVEVDANNPGGALAPGMYAEVTWPVRRNRGSILVPPTAVVTTTDKTFVIRKDQSGKAEYVTVSKGLMAGDMVEVFGQLKDGDQVIKRATDEIRPGQQLK